MKKLSLIILILSIFSNANSQILKKHLDNKLGLYVTLDLRNSIVDYDFFEYYGLKVGLGNKSLRFGASYHILHRNFFSIITSEGTCKFVIPLSESTIANSGPFLMQAFISASISAF